jgi:hypothetical protein
MPTQLATDAAVTLDGLLTAWSGLIGADGLWDGVAPLPDYWAAAAAPAAACALYDKATAASKWQARAVTTIEGALARYAQPNGSFGPTSTGDNSIDTMEFGKVLAVCILVYGDKVPTAQKANWVAAMLGGCEYLNTRGNLRWYTNGNINAGNFVFLRLAYKISGSFKVGQYAEKAWWTLHEPAESIAPDWAGWGFFLSSASPDPYPFDGSAATGYFTEQGAGGNGLDWNYTQYTLDELCLSYVLAPEPRVARLINLLLNTIWPRVDQATQILNATGGTRQGVNGVAAPRSFTTPALAVATRLLARSDLPDVGPQFYTGQGFKETYGHVAPTNDSPGLYRGAYGQLGVFLAVLSG